MKPWERRAVLAMDRAYLSAVSELAKEEAEGGEELTPELLAQIAAG